MPPSLPFTYTRNAVCPHPLRQPPSLLINNLATHNSTIAYVRNTEVYVSNFGSNRLLQLPFRDAVQVFSITILPLSPSPVLCLGMLDGFQLWAVDSCRMVYFHALHPSDTDVCYACASTVLTESAFLVGDSTGAMHTFSAENGSGGSVNFKNKTSVRNHQATISGIARGDKVVASADQLGAVAIYDVSEGKTAGEEGRRTSDAMRDVRCDARRAMRCETCDAIFVTKATRAARNKGGCEGNVFGIRSPQLHSRYQASLALPGFTRATRLHSRYPASLARCYPPTGDLALPRLACPCWPSPSRFLSPHLTCVWLLFIHVCGTMCVDVCGLCSHMCMAGQSQLGQRGHQHQLLDDQEHREYN